MPEPGDTFPMPFIRTASKALGSSCFINRILILAAFSLAGVTAQAQTATPAVSTIVALSASSPTGNLVRGADGTIYGVSTPGSTVASGVIYKTAADGSSVSTLYQMKRDDLNSPIAGLLLASDGKLYGTTKF